MSKLCLLHWWHFNLSRNSEYKVLADTQPNSTGEGGPRDSVTISENGKVWRHSEVLWITDLSRKSTWKEGLTNTSNAPADNSPNTEYSIGPLQKPHFCSPRGEMWFNSAFWMPVGGSTMTPNWHDVLLTPFSSSIAGAEHWSSPDPPPHCSHPMCHNQKWNFTDEGKGCLLCMAWSTRAVKHWSPSVWHKPTICYWCIWATFRISLTRYRNVLQECIIALHVFFLRQQRKAT